jgi:nicotinamidase-related amidase
MTAMNELRLEASRAVVLIIDFQERLLPAMAHAEASLNNAGRLADAARELGLPLLVTEQYPKGIGPTVAALRDKLSATPLDKLEFSVAQNPRAAALLAGWRHAGRDTVLVAGIEAHVCVWQTVADLRAAGWRVHVAADATSSRTVENWNTAKGLWQAAGAVVTSTEAALFDLVRGAQHPNFKAISKLIK